MMGVEKVGRGQRGQTVDECGGGIVTLFEVAVKYSTLALNLDE